MQIYLLPYTLKCNAAKVLQLNDSFSELHGKMLFPSFLSLPLSLIRLIFSVLFRNTSLIPEPFGIGWWVRSERILFAGKITVFTSDLCRCSFIGLTIRESYIYDCNRLQKWEQTAVSILPIFYQTNTNLR